MIYRLFHKGMGQVEYFETRDLAEQKITETVNQQLQNEEYRFPVACVVTQGNDTVWRNIEDTDPEEGDYKVFVHTTGRYEDFVNKTSALQRNQELRNEFRDGLISFFLIEELAEMPMLKNEPAPVIPTETM